MGGRTMKKKKKKNVGAEFLSLAPSQYQERSLEYRVHYRGVPEPFTKVRAVCDSELRDKGEASAREFVNNIHKIRKRDTYTSFGACSYFHPD